MNTTLTQTFNDQQLRHVMIDGEPWFVGVDVLHCLALSTKNGTREHYRKLDDSELTNINRTDLGLSPGRPMRLVTESGLYKLVMRSDKPEAKVFQNWVTK